MNGTVSCSSVYNCRTDNDEKLRDLQIIDYRLCLAYVIIRYIFSNLLFIKLFRN